MDSFITQLFTGVSAGSVLLLISLGLVLTFGQMGVINMAHGEFIMAGAYTTFLTQSILGETGWSLIVALPAGFVVGGIMGLLLEIAVISRLYKRPLDTLLVTVGVSLILQQLARDLFGAPAKEVVTPSWLRGSISVLGYDYPLSRLVLVAVAIVATASLTGVLQFTQLGRKIRATVQNRDLAEVSGVATRTTDRVTFFLGSGLAGVAGVMLTLIGATGPNLGTQYIVDAFLVVVAGGVGQIKGAVIAAFGIGILGAFVESSTSTSMAKVLMLVAVVIFLQVRPNGMFTQVRRGLL